MARPLITRFSPALTTLHSSLAGLVEGDMPVIPGTPGTLSTRRNQAQDEFFVHRYSDGANKPVERYIGLVTDSDAVARARQLSQDIEEINAALADVRLLVRAGYQAADKPSYVTLATLHLHDLFRLGATLIGSHAFGVLTNQLGIRAEGYKTEDIDVARREALALANPVDFLEILKGTGINFVEVPRLKVQEPSTSFKAAGKSRLIVDLLAPSDNDRIGLIPVPELNAHAATLPYLAYLLGRTQTGLLLGTQGICPVRVPVPERFAIHKLIVSQLREKRDAKVDKDLYQASVLLAGLADMFPGAIAEAVREVPLSALSKLKKGWALAKKTWLEPYQEAVEEVTSAISHLEASK
ncbi:MAG: GSU2403 family nucleotidyltransferase fold protein [Pseudomonadota bacterium]